MTSEPSPGQPAPTPLRRALVVDDDVDSARMLRVVLKRLGFEVRIVHDGLAALAEAKAFLPHYILTDVTLPGMTGVELAEALRKSEAYDSIRIFAVTGHSADRLPTPSPFDAHVMKPVDHARLEKLLLIT